MKFNVKGFMFTETIIVATIIGVAIMTTYATFTSLYTNYQKRNSYSSIDGLYAAYNFKNFINDEGGLWFIQLRLEDNIQNNLPYVDLTSCETFLVLEGTYCEEFLDLYDIKKVIFADYNLQITKRVDEYSNDFDGALKDYIIYLSNTSTYEDAYRLILEMNDGTFANILVNRVYL